jgi:sugar transferase EpsL
MAPTSFYATCGKRALDVAVGSALLVLALPVISVLTVAVRLAIGRPVFFVQERPGRGGRVFRLIKFRSMTEARDHEGRLPPDDQRLNRFARVLRRTSLDELPEILNVLKGDMSLVGPRPLLVDYLARYTHEQARRHEVRPGLTGWAEVNGRNALSWEDRFLLDVWYVDHVSLALDLRTIARTALKVITGEGVSEPGHATKSEFRGSTASKD